MYTTGTIENGTGLMSAIQNALTDANWSVIDTLSVADKVFYSSGVDNKSDIYLRVTNISKMIDYTSQSSNFSVGGLITGQTSGASALIIADSDSGTSGKLTIVDINGYFAVGETIVGSTGGSAVIQRGPYSPASVTVSIDKSFNKISFKTYSYWNASTHTGTNEASHVGPWFFLPQIPSNGADEFAKFPRVYNKFLNGAQNQSSYYDLIKFSDVSKFSSPFATTDFWGGYKERTRSVMFTDGYRKIWGMGLASSSSTSYFTNIDIPTRTISTDPANSVGSIYCQDCIVTHINGSTWLYSLNPADSKFAKRNIDTGEIVLLTNCPVSISNNICASAWDGNYTIYYLINNGSTRRVYKYNMLNDTWAVTANAGSSDSWNAAGINSFSIKAVYVRANTVSTSSPWNEDRIIHLLKDGPVTSFAAYNVESDTFTTAAVNTPANMYFTAYNNNAYMTLDDNGILSIKGTSVNSTWYQLNLLNISDGWRTCQENLSFGNDQPGTGRTTVYFEASKIQWGANTKYGILATKDSIAIWTKPQNKKYCWASAGKINSFATTAALTLSGGSGGINASVSVDNIQDLQKGDKVQIFDNTNGTLVLSTIINIVGTVVTLSYLPSITTGTKIVKERGIGITGDTDFFISSEPSSNKTNTFIIDESGSSIYSLKEGFAIYNTPITWPYQDSGTAIKGTLNLVQTITDERKQLASETIIVNKSNQKFIVISPVSRFETGNSRKIAFGPLE